MDEDWTTVEDRVWRESDVILTIPRQRVRVSLVLSTVLLFSFVIGAITYQLLRDVPRSEGEELNEIILPAPVTFVPPTSVLPSSAQLSKVTRFPVDADDDPFIGPPDAPIVIIEFSDYQCYYCGVFARETLHSLLGMYRDQIQFVYRDFVFYGPLSLQAALSAECAEEQNAFWLYHDRLFEHQDNLNAKFFFALAEELNLDVQEFARCVSDPTFEDEVKADIADGQALGIRGTPTFYINGRVLVGAQPLGAFIAVIDEELAAIASPVSSDQSKDIP